MLLTETVTTSNGATHRALLDSGASGEVASPKFIQDCGRTIDTSQSATIQVANGTQCKVLGVVENLEFTMTGNKRVFTIDKVFVMELFEGVTLLLGQTWGKKYKVCQYFGYNVAVGADLDGVKVMNAKRLHQSA